VTIVQNRVDDEPPIADGTPVLVQYSGKYTRVLEDPRVDRSGARSASGAGGAAGGWVDPDIVGNRPSTPEHGDVAAPGPDTWEPVDPVEQPVTQQ
jgi:hypothetical protein